MDSADPEGSAAGDFAFRPASLGPLTLRNRIIKAATFEGRTPRRVVTPELVEFHRVIAAGGVAMTTVAYCAVTLDGSTDGRTIVLDNPAAVDGLAQLAEAVHAEGALVSGQVGHAGPVADPNGTGRPVLTPSRRFTPLGMRLTRAASRDDMVRVRDAFSSGVGRLRAAGFDAVEVHLGHNYLLSAFLSPRLNRRRDHYGGSLDNRARFVREVMTATREAAGPDMAVIAKLSMDDGVRGGFWVDESIQVARWLCEDGTVDALELTGGSSLLNPMYLFRGDAPVDEMAAAMPPLVRPGFRLVGSRFLKAYPYSEAFFRPLARQFLDVMPVPLILLGGIAERSTITNALAEGFSFVAMGRPLLAEPDLVGRYASGESAVPLCIHCNKCMPTIYSGTRCVLPSADPRLSAI